MEKSKKKKTVILCVHTRCSTIRLTIPFKVWYLQIPREIITAAIASDRYVLSSEGTPHINKPATV
jgi:hypothetical protein